MMKVLAAEMTDPSRLRRGKQYAKDGSVIDIVVDPGTVTCEIQGSRSLPYIAVLAVRPGDGMPLRRDVRTTCTCPDDDNIDGFACKHVVAAMFTFSDELLLEPELLDVWRGRAGAAAGADDEHRSDPDDDRGGGRGSDGDRGGRDEVASPTRRRGHLRLVGDDESAPAPPDRPSSPPRDPLADVLSTPAGTELPPVPRLTRIDPDLPANRELARALRDAIGHLRLDWD
jgi:hypothetical protein